MCLPNPTTKSSYLRIAQQTSGNKKAEDDANKEAEEKVKEIEAAGQKYGNKVVEDLLKAVTTPHPEVPDKISTED